MQNYLRNLHATPPRSAEKASPADERNPPKKPILRFRLMLN